MAERNGSPRVSVIITTYNRPSYLEQAVESVLEQTYDDVELVVVDDHSRTPAREVLEDVETGPLSEVECLRHEENRGANAARNTGLEAATGEFVAFLDDDDRWVPEKLQRQVDAFDRAPDDVGVVYTGARVIEEGADRSERIPPPVDGDMTKALLCRNVVGTMSAVMVRADVARATPLDERFPSWADLEWYVRLSRKCAFVRLPEPLVVYEETSHGRLSDDFEKTKRSYVLYVEEFEPLAAKYGTRFKRKMRGWAAFRTGKSAMWAGEYDSARQYFTIALVFYPLEPEFYPFLFASLGGRSTHRFARIAKKLL